MEEKIYNLLFITVACKLNENLFGERQRETKTTIDESTTERNTEIVRLMKEKKNRYTLIFTKEFLT